MYTEDVDNKKLLGMIVEATESIRAKLVETRRLIYSHPEPSYKEIETSRLIHERLVSLGIPAELKVDENGIRSVVGVLTGGSGPGPTVGFRADMDAVYVKDTIHASYRSTVKGIKHACGHDVHTTIGLGIAEVLSAIKPKIKGSVKFLFQPAEEAMYGAASMIRQGVMDNPPMSAIFAYHCAPSPVGTITCREGCYVSGYNRYFIDINDIARPRSLAACLRDINKQNSFSPPKNAKGYMKLLSSIIKHDGQYHDFAILRLAPFEPNRYVLTIKSLTEGGFAKAVSAITGILDGQSDKGAFKYKLALESSRPAPYNSPELLKASRRYLEEAIGPPNIDDISFPYIFAAEDFGMFQALIPGVMFWLGTASPSRRDKGWGQHRPDFDVDEECLQVGTKAMAYALARYLGE